MVNPEDDFLSCGYVFVTIIDFYFNLFYLMLFLYFRFNTMKSTKADAENAVMNGVCPVLVTTMKVVFTETQSNNNKASINKCTNIIVKLFYVTSYVI